MQTISAYLLEKDGLSSELLSQRVEAVHASMTRWLASKGVVDPDDGAGTFASETPGGGGTFTREVVEVDGQYAEELLLRERGNESQEFLTRVCVVAKDGRVAVFASVSAANIGTKVAPRPTHARCPAVLRDVIRQHGDWEIDGAAIPSGRPRVFVGADGGAEVCKIILSGQRRFPLVLISEDEDEFVWDGLDRKLASDLIGLGYVASIDPAAGWEISNRLGRKAACFDGAVRIYWPNTGTSLDQVLSTVWTADRMLDAPSNANAEDRFRDQMRQRVMAASALSIGEPVEIDQVFRAQARRKLAELQGNAHKVDEVYEIANSLAEDLDKAKRRISELETSLSVEMTRAENAEAQLTYARSEVEGGGVADTEEAEESAGDDGDEIAPGTIIYYKKIGSSPNFDVMRRRGDCGHNRWASAHAADKAWKCVERLEERGDWKSFQHCERCQGGGMWKVTW